MFAYCNVCPVFYLNHLASARIPFLDVKCGGLFTLDFLDKALAIHDSVYQIGRAHV